LFGNSSLVGNFYQWIASIAQRCVQVAFLPLILGCYFITLDHLPLTNTVLCLTASSLKIILLHLC
jgi:hypothetical protein